MQFAKIFVLFFLLILASTSAEWMVKSDDFQKAGIKYMDWKPAILATSGQFVVGYDFLDFEQRKKGFVYALRIFRLKKDKTFEIQSIPLPITFLVGVALTNNDKTAVVVGDYGAKIVKVNLTTSEVSTIFQYEKGKPGFRTETLVVSWQDRVYLSGYFYDREQFWQGDYIVELVVPEKKEEAQFIKKTSLTSIYERLKLQPRIMQVISGDSVYFAFLPKVQDKKNPPPMQLVGFHRNEMVEVDKALGIGNFAGTPDRIYCSIRRSPKSWDTYIKNLQTGKKWPLGDKDVSYTYPFISEDGKTVVFCTVDVVGQKMTAYYAQEKDGYKTKLLLKEVPIGPMKLSRDGKAYMYMSKDGVQVDFIPEDNEKP